MKVRCIGQCEIEPDAQSLLGDIYRTWKPLSDPRFANYGTRRFTHLLKLCLVTVAARIAVDIGQEQKASLQVKDVIYANSMLTAIEHDMPMALGEYGASKQSKIAQTILETLRSRKKPMTSKEILSLVKRDLEKPNDLLQILSGMLQVGQVQDIEWTGTGGEKCHGYLAVNKPRTMKEEGKFDLKLLKEFN